MKLCYIYGPWAYFTSAPLDKQWGDDWNDAPYEHNAETPYEWREGSDMEPYEIHLVGFCGPFDTPSDLCGCNSSYSVQKINSGAVAWLSTQDNGPSIFAGALMTEFLEFVIKNGGEIYTKEL